MPERAPPEECANCGAAIPRGAKACPECGADERTGWRDTDEPDYAALDLPEDAFDEHDVKSRGARDDRDRSRDVNGIAWYWWAVGVALLVLLILGGLRLM